MNKKLNREERQQRRKAEREAKDKARQYFSLTELLCRGKTVRSLVETIECLDFNYTDTFDRELAGDEQHKQELLKVLSSHYTSIRNDESNADIHNDYAYLNRPVASDWEWLNSEDLDDHIFNNTYIHRSDCITEANEDQTRSELYKILRALVDEYYKRDKHKSGNATGMQQGSIYFDLDNLENTECGISNDTVKKYVDLAYKVEVSDRALSSSETLSLHKLIYGIAKAQDLIDFDSLTGKSINALLETQRAIFQSTNLSENVILNHFNSAARTIGSLSRE